MYVGMEIKSLRYRFCQDTKLNPGRAAAGQADLISLKAVPRATIARFEDPILTIASMLRRMPAVPRVA